MNIVHQNDKGKSVVDATLKVTTNFTLTTDAKGNVNVSASSTVERVSGHQYSADQLATMGRDVGAIQQSTVMMGFGANTTQMMTALGAAENDVWHLSVAREIALQSLRYKSIAVEWWQGKWGPDAQHPRRPKRI